MQDHKRCTESRSITQAVSRRFLNAEARVCSKVSACGIYGRQSGTGIGFSPNPSGVPCQYRFTCAPYPFIYHWGKRLSSLAHRGKSDPILTIKYLSIICWHENRNYLVIVLFRKCEYKCKLTQLVAREDFSDMAFVKASDRICKCSCFKERS